MSILGKIFGGIFKKKESVAPGGAAPAPAPSGPVATPEQPGVTAAIQDVDVAVILDGLNAQRGSPLNWRTSIVDLMKLVGMDSSLQERKELADELGYTGDKSDSASMNIWLHKQVLQKIRDNGGKLPADL